MYSVDMIKEGNKYEIVLNHPGGVQSRLGDNPKDAGSWLAKMVSDSDYLVKEAKKILREDTFFPYNKRYLKPGKEVIPAINLPLSEKEIELFNKAFEKEYCYNKGIHNR